MKIALVNYRYFVVGGPERYLFNVKQLLEDKGHEVIPFSIKHPKNVKSDYSEDFASSLGDGQEVFYKDYQISRINTFAKLLGRVLYSFEVKVAFKGFLKKHKPDVVYLLQHQSKMSVSVVDAAYEMNIPIVQRISDFGYICANRFLFNEKKREVCEKCLHGSLVNAVNTKCCFDSRILSAIKAFSVYLQKRVNVNKKISAFVFTCESTKRIFAGQGFDRNKLHCIPTFFNSKNAVTSEIKYEPFALYVGRLDPDKGIATLLKAFLKSGRPLKIIGFSSTSYWDSLAPLLKDGSHAIEYLGRLDFDEMSKYLANCLFTIVPSEWYDNLPNTVLESYAFRKCVVASGIGSLNDVVVEGNTGLHFATGNVDELIRVTNDLFNNPLSAFEMGQKAFNQIKTIYSGEEHYTQLIELFKRVGK